ncbi:MAG: prepilin-type N-terminal cleavage/methylation domain-containing protein [Candidatus Omnitrophica bacterium]|nr:prepilin-type N-terminal cleavage/methylation domain-containing protein [Candidatus Omnitrophota bacterium]MDD5238009.1 prepilin-type N-terminal cleavage/methylation domain-containing protein [Candidatus Omnitrophota bacterium]
MNRKAFTLVEIMIVVAITLLLASIAIPNLLRVRVTAQEASAAAAMHTIATAEIQWRISNPTYTSLAQMGSATPPYIDAILATGTKQGYIFSMVVTNMNQFAACAMQQSSQAHTFYIDESGVVCRSMGVPQACPGMHLGGQCAGAWEQMQ